MTHTQIQIANTANFNTHQLPLKLVLKMLRPYVNDYMMYFHTYVDDSLLDQLKAEIQLLQKIHRSKHRVIINESLL